MRRCVLPGAARGLKSGQHRGSGGNAASHRKLLFVGVEGLAVLDLLWIFFFIAFSSLRESFSFFCSLTLCTLPEASVNSSACLNSTASSFLSITLVIQSGSPSQLRRPMPSPC